MTYLSKRIRNNSFAVCITLLLLLTACDEEKVNEQVVARVGDAILTDEDVTLALDTAKQSKLYRQEYIRRWVENEILYQEAINREITKRKDYLNQLRESKQKLAGGILVEELIADTKLEISDAELKEYFEKHKSEFQVQSNAYVVNVVCFKDRDEAESYRAKLLTSDWNKVFSTVRKNAAFSNVENKFVYDYEIDNSRVKRILSFLRPDDISVVIPDGKNRFCIYSIKRKYEVNDVPVFEDVKSEVRERFVMIKHKELYRSIINNLYSKYEVKIY